MNSDDVTVRLGLLLFELQVTFIPTITDFIQYGGIEFLQKVILQYTKHEFLSLSAPKLLKTVLGTVVASIVIIL